MAININGVLCRTEEELEAAMAELPEDQKLFLRNDFYGNPNPTYPLNESARRKVEEIVAAASQFGQSLMVSFAAENVLMGITQDGKTGEVLDKLAPVMSALQAGSLYLAIEKIRSISPTQYDPKYVTAPRLLQFINKIETYLGMPPSNAL